MIKFVAKILPFEIPAQSGDLIPEHVLMKYIKSEDFNHRLKSGTILGGMSHASRKAKEEGIPAADQILLDGNAFFKMIDAYVEGKFLMGVFEVFENLQLSGPMQNSYTSFLNMMRTGSKPPVSSCIRAYWDNNICQEIVFLRGVDVTLQPGFVGSEITDIIIS